LQGKKFKIGIITPKYNNPHIPSPPTTINT
jgi:hypothetical protein